MMWHNCIEFEQATCLFYLRGIDCDDTLDSLAGSIPPQFPGVVKEKICAKCTLKGFYFEGKRGDKKKTIPALHSQALLRLACDIQDATTSPNDPGLVSGYHSNVDHNHMTWMINTFSKLSSANRGYPESQDQAVIQNSDHLSGTLVLLIVPRIRDTFLTTIP
jgi:hypothetical protein